MTPASVFLIVAAASQYSYDDHEFNLGANTSAFVLINDSGFFPAVQDNYVVHNIGRSSIEAELWYGDEVQWFGIVCGATIEPGEVKILDNGQKPYYYTGLKVLNNNEERALFHGQGGYLQYPYTPGDHFSMFKSLRNTFRLSIKYVPIKSVNIFEELALSFWPGVRPSIWQEILDYINPLLGKNLTAKMNQIIQQDLNPFRNEFHNLTYENETRDSYMSIAIQLEGLENNFRYLNTTLYEVYVLPIFSNIVSMKIHYYVFGLQYKDTLGLSADDTQKIKTIATTSFNEAVDHISNVSKFVLGYTYNVSEAPGIFNDFMTIRSHLAIHGDEYIPIWKHKLEKLSSYEVYNPVISYSIFFGRPTGSLYAQSTPEQIPPPLTPNWEISKRTQLTRIMLYLWCTNPFELKIGGARVIFQNGEDYFMGTKTAIVENVDLDGAQIVQLSAFGEGKIDGLKFYLSNGKILSYGQVNCPTYMEFMLPDHYVSSFYLSSDDPDLDGQAGNIAVSFQWLVK